MVSSGAIMPARAPASMDMLQIVIRPSMERARIASPVYSSTYPVPPAVPMRRISARMRSFAPTPGLGVPVKRTSIVRGRDCTMHWVARTCSTSLVPIPKARAPKAPWVEVCESPQTMTVPGRVAPSSGPITWTMPWSGESRSMQLDAGLAGVAHQRGELPGRDRVRDRQAPVAGGDVVIHRGQREVGAADAPPRQPEPFEGLGRGDLVDQVEIHVQQRRPASSSWLDDVGVPDLLEQRASGHQPCTPAAGRRAAGRSLPEARALASPAFPSSAHGIIARSLAPTCSIW